ncbi:MAG: SRPBCC family protein [Terriglobales bacterium]
MAKHWRGFAAGAAAGAGLTFGSVALVNTLFRRNARVIRLEKSIQIGRPQDEVFRAWAEMDRLPRWSNCVEEIRKDGDRSHWKVKVDGRSMEWDSAIEQFIPNQAIGWKSLNGPKHTGRITFAPIGSDTLVQVTMNYAPPSRWLPPFAASAGEHLERYIDQALRDFKAGMEGKGQENAKLPVRAESERIGPGTAMTQTDVSRATGTFGPEPTPTAVDKFGNRANPVEYTSPPEAKR